MANKQLATSDDEGWEEKGHDNGDLIQWKTGEKHQGVFIGRHLISLPVSDQNPDIGDGTGGQAEMLVFENRQHGGARWSTWLTYQLAEAFEDISEGTECRIECLGERKARVGNVKLFSIKTRAPRPVVEQEELF